MIALYIYTRNNKSIRFIDWADIAAPSLALGQAIGRWGNFFNQELYGAPTDLPWKLYIDPAHRLPGFESVAYYHPLFAYESILNLANMLLLLWLMRRYVSSLRRGDIFNVYLIVYPAIRFSLDFLRLDASQVLSININQTLMAIVGIAAVAVLIWRHRPGSMAPAAYSTLAGDEAVTDEVAADQGAADVASSEASTATDETPDETSAPDSAVKRRRATNKAG